MNDASSAISIAGLAVNLLVFATVIWRGGRLSQQVDTLAEASARHDSDIRDLLVAKGESAGHRHALASYHDGED